MPSSTWHAPRGLWWRGAGHLFSTIVHALTKALQDTSTSCSTTVSALSLPALLDPIPTRTIKDVALLDAEGVAAGRKAEACIPEHHGRESHGRICAWAKVQVRKQACLCDELAPIVERGRRRVLE